MSFLFPAIRFFEGATEQAAVRIIEEEAQLPQETFDRVGFRLFSTYEGIFSYAMVYQMF